MSKRITIFLDKDVKTIEAGRYGIIDIIINDKPLSVQIVHAEGKKEQYEGFRFIYTEVCQK